MASILPGYEYDIFISYRQNDNKRDKWVTEFVSALQDELDATLKNTVSIYFDENPHDGLLETHDVDRSLEKKLKCLIFIPIISQTYCDANCFAWEHELLPFIELAKKDELGMNITLANRNVASRILPIRIHDIDAEDTSLFESVTDGRLRPIDFIYKTKGVNRPLKPVIDDVNTNEYHSVYRDQINKVANALKEIGIALLRMEKGEEVTTKDGQPHKVPLEITNKPSSLRYVMATIMIVILAGLGYWWFQPNTMQAKNIKVVSKSLAVLPFKNLSGDVEQDYFSAGMTDDILNHLFKISDLQIKSRTSTLQYKDTNKTIPTIGEELVVDNILEGSVRRIGNKVRIVVQLIDTEKDVQLWGETYDREVTDVLAIQSEIALMIANALELQLSVQEKKNIEKQVSNNVTAYDYYIKAREITYKFEDFDEGEFNNAIILVNMAIDMDSSFADAAALKGLLWHRNRLLGTNNKIWSDSALFYTTKAIEIDSTSPYGYLYQSWTYSFLGRNKMAKRSLEEAYKNAPSNGEVMNNYGYQLLRDKNELGASLIMKANQNLYSITDPEYYLALSDVYSWLEDFEMMKATLFKARSLDPGSNVISGEFSWMYQKLGHYDLAIAELNSADTLGRGTIDWLGWNYYLKGDYKNAIKYWSKYPEIESKLKDSTQTVPFRHRLGMTYAKLGNKVMADSLFTEDLYINNEAIQGNSSIGAYTRLNGFYYGKAICEIYFGNYDEAVDNLDTAWNMGFNVYWLFRNDPMFEAISEREDFKTLLKKVNTDFAFRKKAFGKALNEWESSNDLKRLLDK